MSAPRMTPWRVRALTSIPAAAWVAVTVTNGAWWALAAAASLTLLICGGLYLWAYAHLAGAKLHNWREERRTERLRAEYRANLASFRALLAEHGIDTADLTDEQIEGALHEGWGMHLNDMPRDEMARRVVGGLRRLAERQGGRA